jgi:hypothetical protein
MAISNTILSTIASNIYVSSGNTVISVMYFYNNDSTTRAFNVFLLPSGTSAATNATQIYGNVQVTPADTFVIDLEKIVLSNGDMIRASATANVVVTASVSYIGM